MKLPDIEVHIAQLVLDGFPRGDALRIAKAVEQELQRLFLARGAVPVASRSVEIQVLNIGEFEMNSDSRAEVTGARVARLMYGGLTENESAAD